MKRFFTNKYPINYGQDKDGKLLTLDIGTCFTIKGIVGNDFELEPINLIKDMPYPVMVGASMLVMGFNTQDHVTT